MVIVVSSVLLRALIRRLTTTKMGELAGGFESPALNAAIAREALED
jgi:hypothetical protein